jgi:hypothetical protein
LAAEAMKKLKLKQLHIQIQNIKNRHVRIAADQLVSIVHFARDYYSTSVRVEEFDKDYLNIDIHCMDPYRSWCEISDCLRWLPSKQFLHLRQNWIVTVEGDLGWDDYLLLDSFSKQFRAE